MISMFFVTAGKALMPAGPVVVQRALPTTTSGPITNRKPAPTELLNFAIPLPPREEQEATVELDRNLRQQSEEADQARAALAEVMPCVTHPAADAHLLRAARDRLTAVAASSTTSSCGLGSDDRLMVAPTTHDRRD
jgi:hypothetical protein